MDKNHHHWLLQFHGQIFSLRKPYNISWNSTVSPVKLTGTMVMATQGNDSTVSESMRQRKGAAVPCSEKSFQTHTQTHTHTHTHNLPQTYSVQQTVVNVLWGIHTAHLNEQRAQSTCMKAPYICKVPSTVSIQPVHFWVIQIWKRTTRRTSLSIWSCQQLWPLPLKKRRRLTAIQQKSGQLKGLKVLWHFAPQAPKDHNNLSFLCPINQDGYHTLLHKHQKTTTTCLFYVPSNRTAIIPGCNNNNKRTGPD